MLDLNNDIVLASICGIIGAILYNLVSKNDKNDKNNNSTNTNMIYSFVIITGLVYGALYYKNKGQSGGSLNNDLVSTYSENVQILDPDF